MRRKKKLAQGGPGPITKTQLSPMQEMQFGTWRMFLPPALQNDSDYDLRGLWKSNPAIQPSANLHFPDTYKLPNHPTFSDESVYFNPSTRDQAGHWNETDSSWNWTPYNSKVRQPISEKKQLGGRKMAVGGPGPANNSSMGPITFLNSYFESPEFESRFKLDGKPTNLYNSINYMLAMKDFRSGRDNYKPFIDRTDLKDDKEAKYHGSQAIDINNAGDAKRFAEIKGLPRRTNVIINPNEIPLVANYTTGDQIERGLKYSSDENDYYAINSTLPHEYTHTIRSLSSSEQSRIQGLNKNDSQTINNSAPHDLRPNEQYSDLNALRWQLYKEGIYDSRKGKLDLPTLNKALQNDRIKKDPLILRLLDHFTPENLVEFNNTIAGQPQSTPTSKRGGRTPTTPQYLTTYPNTPSMRKSLRGKKMLTGGRHFDPQLGNYMSNIYDVGGLIPPGFPYAGYNDAERHMFSGMMAFGGPSGPGLINTVNGAAAQSSANGDFSTVDRLNAILSGRSKNVGLADPTASALAMQAYLWRQQSPGRPADQMISSFYGRPATSGNSADSLRRRLSNIGYGPNAMFNDTPDMTVRAMGGITPKQKYGSAPADELREDWKDVFYDNPDYKKGGKHWIQGAINPAHKGYCTPMSKPTCTGHRRALALMFKKKHGFHKKEEGGYLQGMEMADGGYPNPYPAPYGYPGSFSPAGSLVDQNQWAMIGDDSPVSPSYRKSANYAPGLASTLSGPHSIGPDQIIGAPRAPVISQMARTTGRTTFGTPNLNNLSWLLPLNAGLGIASQANQYNQNRDYRTRNMNNPLQNLGYANGRPDEVKYGYQPFRRGGETMPFAGVPMKLWKYGGSSGAATPLHPYMLHQGRFDYGGDLQDQWDAEDFQDQQQQIPQEQSDGFEPDDWDMRRKANLSNDDDYEAALQIALQDNPYW